MKFIAPIFVVSAICVLLLSSSFALPAADIAQANNEFAFDLYSHLDSSNGNIFFSPYSLSSALTMTFEGARNETADQMRMTLYLPSDEVDWRSDLTSFIQSVDKVHSGYELSIANALWAQKDYPFTDEYLAETKNTYLAQARNLDFVANPEASRLVINSWVSENTKNRINDLLPVGSINSSVKLILTNAVYFKGRWSQPFNKIATEQDDFWISPTESVQTAMMGLTGTQFKYLENEQVQLLELPYQGHDISILIVLPRSKDLKNLEKSINEVSLKNWIDVMSKQWVNIFIPKFKFDANYQMKDVLIQMGMANAFNPNQADFSGMTSKPNIYIDQVYHRAWIDVDEEGTEAAAATAIDSIAESIMVMPSPPKIFRADHPFIFVIQDNKTGQILFMGRVFDPREK